MAARKPITPGMEFGYLTVLSQDRPRYIRCRCVCGVEKEFRIDHLGEGKSRSCGCLKGELATIAKIKHGHALGRGTPEYKTWMEMIGRCTRRSNGSFARYGGRGISVCERWKASFQSFYEDMGPRPRGTSIDRIDPNGDYEPDNCRWATPLVQSRNRSCVRKFEFRGQEMTMQELSDLTGIRVATLRYRLVLKRWPLKRALSQPVRAW